MKYLIIFLLVFSVSCSDKEDNVCLDLNDNIVGTWKVRDINLDMDAGTVTFLEDNTGFSSANGAFASSNFMANQTDFTWLANNLLDNQLQLNYVIPNSQGLEAIRSFESQGNQCDEIILFQFDPLSSTTIQTERYILTPL